MYLTTGVCAEICKLIHALNDLATVKSFPLSAPEKQVRPRFYLGFTWVLPPYILLYIPLWGGPEENLRICRYTNLREPTPKESRTPPEITLKIYLKESAASLCIDRGVHPPP